MYVHPTILCGQLERWTWFGFSIKFLKKKLYLLCLQAPFTSTIPCYFQWPWPWLGSQVQCKAKPVGFILSHFWMHQNEIWYGVRASQVEHHDSTFEWDKTRKVTAVTKCRHAFRHLWIDLVESRPQECKKAKNLRTNYLTNFSISLEEIWHTVKACWTDEPHSHFVFSDQYSREKSQFG